MAYVYLDPADYIVGKPISFEEYAQLVENANQAYGAGTNHGEIFATRSAVTAVGTSVTGSAPGPYSWVVPAGVTKIYADAIGGGGGGGDGNSPDTGGGGGAGAYESQRVLSVTPGETLTITPGAPGVGALTSAGTAGAASTISGSVSGLILSAAGGSGGTRLSVSGAGGVAVRGWDGGTGAGGGTNQHSPIQNTAGVYNSGGSAGPGAGGAGADGSGFDGIGGFVRLTF
jgi:hypothetical protein